MSAANQQTPQAQQLTYAQLQEQLVGQIAFTQTVTNQREHALNTCAQLQTQLGMLEKVYKDLLDAINKVGEEKQAQAQLALVSDEPQD